MSNADITGLSVETLKAWAAANQGYGRALIVARGVAKAIRIWVDSYTTPIVAQFDFVDEDTGERITKPGDVWNAGASEETFERYYAALDAAHRAHGFTGPEGHCPALIAESQIIDAENTLLRSLCDFIGARSLPFGKLRERALKIALDCTTATLE